MPTLWVSATTATHLVERFAAACACLRSTWGHLGAIERTVAEIAPELIYEIETHDLAEFAFVDAADMGEALRAVLRRSNVELRVGVEPGPAPVNTRSIDAGTCEAPELRMARIRLRESLDDIKGALHSPQAAADLDLILTAIDEREAANDELNAAQDRLSDVIEDPDGDVEQLRKRAVELCIALNATRDANASRDAGSAAR